jgi:hypothetical protein
MSEQRIMFDDVEFDDDLRCVRGGEPVNGPVWEEYADGTPLSETNYRDGIRDGAARGYRPDGTVDSEDWYEFGSIRRRRSWHPNGQLSRERNYERGRLVQDRSWAPDGRPVEPASGQQTPPPRDLRGRVAQAFRDLGA